MKIVLVKPRGFCAGVDRAIDTVKLALEIYGRPIYVKHAIVHNDKVVKDLENQGVIFVESVKEIPRKSQAIFSAHGSPPEDYQLAKSRKINLIDATCPLVTKVHLEVKRFAKEGYKIILVGHKNHMEMIGTSGEAPENITIVEFESDINNLNLSLADKIVVLNQTTLSVDKANKLAKKIKDKYPNTILPSSSDICYATTNRQVAVKYLAKIADLILVVGSATSSNTNRLVEVVKNAGVVSFRINGSEDIKNSWFNYSNNINIIGITSGASVPDDIVQQVIKYLQNKFSLKVEEREVIKEQVWFDLPSEIKEVAQRNNSGNKLIRKHNISADSKMIVK